MTAVAAESFPAAAIGGGSGGRTKLSNLCAAVAKPEGSTASSLAIADLLSTFFVGNHFSRRSVFVLRQLAPIRAGVEVHLF
ncbi:hypothetical protein I546_5351 [Mycobacterium kansasii 732]|nr:hypothetical protein I546_5351 [Mycobacterium kansasii 732]